MGTPVSSIVFAGTNFDKGMNGDWWRYGTALAQAKTATEGLAKSCSSPVAERIGKSLSYIDDLAKEQSLAGGFSRTLQFIQKNINPTIIACAGLKVATADDKEKELWNQGSGLAGMFASEGLYKAFQSSGACKSMLASIAKFGGGGTKGKVLAAITEGVGFAAASILGWKAAAYVGNNIYEKTNNINLIG